MRNFHEERSLFSFRRTVRVTKPVSFSGDEERYGTRKSEIATVGGDEERYDRRLGKSLRLG